MAKIGPKMAKKVTGVPKKIPQKYKKIEKMTKNGPTEPRVIALKNSKNALKMSKRVKKGSKRGQKSVKNDSKNGSEAGLGKV